MTNTKSHPLIPIFTLFSFLFIFLFLDWKKSYFIWYIISYTTRLWSGVPQSTVCTYVSYIFDLNRYNWILAINMVRSNGLYHSISIFFWKIRVKPCYLGGGSRTRRSSACAAALPNLELTRTLLDPWTSATRCRSSASARACPRRTHSTCSRFRRCRRAGQSSDLRALPRHRRDNWGTSYA